MTAINVQIALTAQQRHDFATCAEACGLDLAGWIVQCAAVQAAAAIDAMQAPFREQRKRHEKPQRRPRDAKAESLTLEAARSYNVRFRGRPKGA